MYVDGPNGTKLCVKHDEQFKPPHACPKCRRAQPKPAASSLAPEIDRAMRDTAAMYMGVAEDAAEMAANATSETARVQALRVRLSALELVGKTSMERAKAEMLDRLANRRPAAIHERDPRDDFGTAASSEIFVEGDN